MDSFKNTQRSSLGITARQIPTTAYAYQNLKVSLCDMASAIFTFFFTLCVVLPLSYLRGFLPKRMLIHGAERGPAVEELTRNKVVMIVDAAMGVGLDLMKLYSKEDGTVVIAVSRSIDAVRDAYIQLGDTPATIQCVDFNIKLAGTHQNTKKQISEQLKMLDKQYGPVTHFYEVGGMANNVPGIWKEAGSEMDTSAEAINANMSCTVHAVQTMYEVMKSRGYGKICIVNPASPTPRSTAVPLSVAFESTKAYLNAYSSTLRVIAAPNGVEVVGVQVEAMAAPHKHPHPHKGKGKEGIKLAREMKRAVEEGGAGVVWWPTGIILSRTLNPILEELILAAGILLAKGSSAADASLERQKERQKRAHAKKDKADGEGVGNDTVDDTGSFDWGRGK